MRYYRGLQFVPMKGNAATYYETDDEGRVLRVMTVVASTGEVERLENPPVKRLFRPESLETIEASEFNRYWNSSGSSSSS